MIDKSVPCYNEGKGCDRRRVTSEYNCHSDCPDYKNYHDKRSAKLELISKKRAEDAMITDVRMRSIEKTTRNKTTQGCGKG